MQFRIADTFTDSLAHLTADEQKAVKTTAFDLQINPADPGMKFHRLDRARDKNFWSVRASGDIRLIVHKTAADLLLCYAGHHDQAYAWAERRKLETHPRTGAAQFVEIRETVKEIRVPTYVPMAMSKQAESTGRLFADIADDDLLGYGVPSEWLADVRGATEQTLLGLAEHLPAEASEALLQLATGGKPHAAQHKVPAPASLDSPFDHPEAQRRLRLMGTAAELERALDYPWEKWSVFLHPEQRHLVETNFNGPARVSGSAGTGKTIVALHRAVHLARQYADARILLATFSESLAHVLHAKLTRLVSNEPMLAERIEVYSLDALALRLYQALVGPAQLARRELLVQLVREASQATDGHKFGLPFLLAEWDQIVDAWQLGTWEAYRDVARLGRKTRLAEPQRKVLWSIFEHVRAALSARNVITNAALFTALASLITKNQKPPFDFAIVDESQDLSVSQMRFFAALGGDRPNALFFAGDLGQRIFQQPFSWKALGIDVRGRSRTLRVNYRTSHQIRAHADRLLGPQVVDVDGVAENRATVSVFNGPVPAIRTLESQAKEAQTVAEWLRTQTAAGMLPHEIAIFVRSEAQFPRAMDAVKRVQASHAILDEHAETARGRIAIGTMHLAKGLEFRAVAVMACDDEIIPSQARIEAVGDEADLKEIYDTERQLLYVACTRER